MRVIAIQPFLHGPAISPSPGGRAIITHSLMQRVLQKNIMVAVFPHNELIAEDSVLRVAEGSSVQVYRSVPRGKDINIRLVFKAIANHWVITKKMSGLSRTVAEFLALDRAQKDFLPDIVHTHNSRLSIVDHKSNSSRRPKLITTEHKLIEKDVARNYDKYDHLVFISKFQQEESMKFEPKIVNKSQVIYNYASNEYHEKQSDPKENTLLYLGSLNTPKKGFGTLLTTIEKYGLPQGARLRVIGDGVLKNQFAQRAQSSIISDRVSFLGRLTTTGNVSELEAAAVLVVPSHTEGFGNVYAEALCMGVPVIGYHKTVNEISELIGMSVGLPFDVRKQDHSELYECINSMLLGKFMNTDYRMEVSRRARAAFSFERYVADYLKLYKSLFASEGVRS